MRQGNSMKNMGGKKWLLSLIRVEGPCARAWHQNENHHGPTRG